MPLFDDAALRTAVMERLQDAPKPQGIGVAPYLAAEGGQGADLATTLMALRDPRAHETNPLGVGGVIAGKAALMAVAPFLMKKLAESGHPTAAKVLGYSVGAAGAVPAIWNAAQMVKAK